MEELTTLCEFQYRLTGSVSLDYLLKMTTHSCRGRWV